MYLCMNNMDSYVLEEEITFQVCICMRIMERNVYLCMNNFVCCTRISTQVLVVSFGVISYILA